MMKLPSRRYLGSFAASRGLRWALIASIAALAACNREVREWTPTDHDQPANADNGAPPPRRPAGSEAAPDENLIELAWQKSCATCHGPRGRGDGPEGPMVHAADLTRADWQDHITDAQMKETIRKGRNRMPPFDLPPAVIDGLVLRIRAARQR